MVRELLCRVFVRVDWPPLADDITGTLSRSSTKLYRGVLRETRTPVRSLNELRSVEFVTVRVADRSVTPKLADDVPSDSPATPVSTRQVYFEDKGWVDTEVYERQSLVPWQSITRPAVFEEKWAYIISAPIYGGPLQ